MTKRSIRRHKKRIAKRKYIIDEVVKMFLATDEFKKLFDMAPDAANQMVRDSIKESIYDEYI